MKDLSVETNPSVESLREVVSYVNRNLREGSFPRIATNHEIPMVAADRWHALNASGGQIYAIGYHAGRVIGASHIDVSHGRRSHCGILAVTVDQHFRNRGIATRLLETITRECQRKNVSHLRAAPTADNEPMKKVLEKLQFRFEGNLLSAFRSDEGQYIDLVQYLLITDGTN